MPASPAQDPYLYPISLAKFEIRQAASVGHKVEALEREAVALEKKKSSPQVAASGLRLYEKALRLGLPKGFAYKEPDDLKAIRKLRPQGPRRLNVRLDWDRLADRIRGAWLGRIAGCLCGKPVEGWDRRNIRQLLVAARAYPLENYFPPVKLRQGGYRAATPRNWLRGHISGAPRDDDTDYTVLNLRVLEAKGTEMTTADVGEAWLKELPFLATYSAERVAYRNLVNKVPETATFRNPYREWIGAQIRADAFGYACPGWPEKAAELAWRDASLSHTANGLYGEMFVAATIAAALVVDDVGEAFKIGLSEIPANSRLAEVLRETWDFSTTERDWERTATRVLERYGGYHKVHTINNAALVVMGLAYAAKQATRRTPLDFTTAVGVAVMPGLDTDCNGATAGSVAGALLGAESLDRRWVEPMRDSLATSLASEGTVAISDLAERTVAVARHLCGAPKAPRRSGRFRAVTGKRRAVTGKTAKRPAIRSARGRKSAKSAKPAKKARKRR